MEPATLFFDEPTPGQQAADLFGPGDGVSPDQVAAYARRVLDARRLKDAADAAAAAAGHARDAAEEELIRAMDAAGLTAVKLEGGATLTASSRSSYGLPAGALDDAALVAWIESSGGGPILKRNVHPQTFSAFCRELAAREAPIHPAVRVFTRRVVSVKKC